MLKRTLGMIAVIVFGFTCALGQGKHLTTDSLTGLPLYSGADPGGPIQMPSTPVCKSKKQANFYKISKNTTDDAVAWYSSHLSGFKKISGYDSQRGEIAFINADGTLLVLVTGDQGAKGQNTAAYSVSYERFQPGISEKTAESFTTGKLVCNAN